MIGFKMGFLDNLFSNYSDLKKYGISEAQAKELDMLDGAEDKKLYGKSIFTEIAKYKNQYDKSNKQRDLVTFIRNTFAYDGLFGETSVDEIADDLINEIFGVINAKLNSHIKKINENNVVEILEAYKKKSDKKNSVLGVKYDNETLIEAILDENISNDEKKKFINHIKEALAKRAINLSGNTEYIGKVFESVIDETLEEQWPLQDSQNLDKVCSDFIKVIKNLEKMNQLNNDKKSKSETSLLYLNNLEAIAELLNINSSDLLGNGNLDNSAVQMTGNCLLHSKINALLTTDKGRQYLNNLIVKDKSTGNITVFLPGAERLNVPVENPGYFTYSPAEIAQRILKTSMGDGDMTALTCAIEDARKLASGDENATSVGNSTDISIEELLFLQKSKFLKIDSKNSALYKSYRQEWKNFIEECRELNDEEYARKAEIEYNKTLERLKHYDDWTGLKERFESENYAFTVGVQAGQVIKGFREGKEITLLDNHSYAVVGIDEMSAILVESNSPESPIKVSREELSKTIIRYIEIFVENNVPSTKSETDFQEQLIDRNFTTFVL